MSPLQWIKQTSISSHHPCAFMMQLLGLRQRTRPNNIDPTEAQVLPRLEFHFTSRLRLYALAAVAAAAAAAVSLSGLQLMRCKARLQLDATTLMPLCRCWRPYSRS